MLWTAGYKILEKVFTIIRIRGGDTRSNGLSGDGNSVDDIFGFDIGAGDINESSL